MRLGLLEVASKNLNKLEMVQASKDWAPHNYTELRSFLVDGSVYKIFVANHARIAHTLTKKLSKCHQFKL